ncbi:MAG: LytR C-terminal domain-containing protein [Actinomycetota bacterium]|nr:LytR C-terminal domain-containing protein [Actinomycetota bacterium]
MVTRAGRPGRQQQGQATPSIVAVVSVVAVVAAMVAFFAGGDQQSAPEPQAQSAPAPSRTPTPAAESTARAQATPTGSPSDTATERPRRDQRDQKRRHRREPADQGPPDVYIEVYNNSSVSGLAASTAADLQDGGWQVVGVDNWYGAIPASTVYYPAGMEAEADELAQTLGLSRVRGAVAPMKFDRLTVILTADAA